jgi:hypothetical protein
MVFRVEDFHDLVRLLEERPEWRAEVRRLVLTEELLAMPEQLARLRQETEGRFETLAAALASLTAQVDTLTSRLEALTTQVSIITGHVGDLRGESLERRYRTRVFSYFAPLLRRPHVLTPDETVSLLEEALERGVLDRAQANEVSRTDIVVRGTNPADGSALYLVVEVSAGVGVSDVRRAADRASFFQRMGVVARAVVASEWLTPEAIEAARSLGVWQLTDGQVVAPCA